MSRWTLIVALVVSSSCSLAEQPTKKTEAEAIWGLRGPVHTVLVKKALCQNDPNCRPVPSESYTFDIGGYRTEEYNYESDGTIRSHIKYTRNGWQILKTESVSPGPSQDATITRAFDADGHITKTETYDSGGVLTSVTKDDFSEMDASSRTVTEQVMNADGATSRSKTITVDSTDPVTGVTRQTTTKDGKLFADSAFQKDAKGNVRSAVIFGDGSSNEREIKPDGTFVERMSRADSEMVRYQTTNAKGQLVELIDESPRSYVKTTYRYDDAGRGIETAEYDRSGKLLRKMTNAYTDDGYGNWIEQRQFNWDLEHGSPKLFFLADRVITYY